MCNLLNLGAGHAHCKITCLCMSRLLFLRAGYTQFKIFENIQTGEGDSGLSQYYESPESPSPVCNLLVLYGFQFLRRLTGKLLSGLLSRPAHWQNIIIRIPITATNLIMMT